MDTEKHSRFFFYITGKTNKKILKNEIPYVKLYKKEIASSRNYQLKNIDEFKPTNIFAVPLIRFYCKNTPKIFERTSK